MNPGSNPKNPEVASMEAILTDALKKEREELIREYHELIRIELDEASTLSEKQSDRLSAVEERLDDIDEQLHPELFEWLEDGVHPGDCEES